MKHSALEMGRILWVICFFFIAAASAQEAAMLPLMPVPASFHTGEGWFPVNQSLHVATQGNGDSRVSHAVERFFRNLASRTGIPLRNTPADNPNFFLNCAASGEKIQSFGEDESYRLEVTSTAIRLDAPNPLGIIHGLQTFLQLVRLGPDGFIVPAIIIEDRPRFLWRGLLMDVSRHFMPVSVLKRNLDGMEALKFNVLHWHLSDDQGFRVESRKFSRLQELSSDGM